MQSGAGYLLAHVRYRFEMAFVVRWSPEETEALRGQAAREHRSMHEVAVLAIRARVDADQRAATLDELFDAAVIDGNSGSHGLSRRCFSRSMASV